MHGHTHGRYFMVSFIVLLIVAILLGIHVYFFNKLRNGESLSSGEISLGFYATIIVLIILVITMITGVYSASTHQYHHHRPSVHLPVAHEHHNYYTTNNYIPPEHHIDSYSHYDVSGAQHATELADSASSIPGNRDGKINYLLSSSN